MTDTFIIYLSGDSDFEQRRFEPELDYCYAQGWNRLVSAYSFTVTLSRESI